MKQLLQYSSRSLLDSFIASSKTPRYSRALFIRAQAPSCPKCRSLITQRRHYSQLENKPIDSKAPASDASPEISKTESENSPNLRDEQVERDEDPSLPSQEESRRSRASKKVNELMDNLQTNLFRASQRLNDLTGYASIEHLKLSIEDLESQTLVSQELVRQTRAHYKQTVAERASTQREVTTLLARKDTWTGEDLQRFTELYRSDHEVERKVQEAAQELAEREREAERVSVELQRGILKRYHEEQIWSDKIRRMSTWGTWGLMGVNVVLFLVVQFGFEPWRRRRLVKGFEEKVIEALTLEKARTQTEPDQATETSKVAAPASSNAGTNGSEDEDGNGAGKLAATVEAAVAVTMKELEAAERRLATELGVSTEEIQAETTKAEEPPIENVSDLPPLEEPKTRVGGLLDNIEISAILRELRNPQHWRITAFTKDLFSEKVISLRKQDLTIIALEGAATGAAAVGIIVTIIFRRN